MKKEICLILSAVLLSLLFACSSAPKSVSSLSSGRESAASSAVSKRASSHVSSAAASVPASSGKAPSSQTPEKTKTVKLTIPEGFALPQVAARLEAHGVCGGADFIKASQTYDFSYYPLAAKIKSSPHRCYRLEGYLYPETYEFYLGMKPQDAVGKFLRRAESQIGTRYSYSGMTTDQLITLASVIEREADNPDDMKKVSSVFHNRLKAGMILQADSTRDYCNKYLVPKFGSKFNRYYNTYPHRSPGLPAGPICNPGANALYAAAHPANTNYLYFATGTDHNYYYGATQKGRDALMASAGVTPLYAD